MAALIQMVAGGRLGGSQRQRRRGLTPNPCPLPLSKGRETFTLISGLSSPSPMFRGEGTGVGGAVAVRDTQGNRVDAACGQPLARAAWWPCVATAVQI